jgi:hypothetical protein
MITLISFLASQLVAVHLPWRPSSKPNAQRVKHRQASEFCFVPQADSEITALVAATGRE